MLRHILIILLLPISLFAELPEIGTILHSNGRIDIISAGCYNDSCRGGDNKIFPGDKIKSLPLSRGRILLKDGTGIEITDSSSIIVESIREREKNPPSLLRAKYGTFTITRKNRFTDTSLVIETETALIKSVNASLYIIAAKDVTAIMVYSSRAGIASADPSIRQAYIPTEGGRTIVPKNQAPENPDRVDILLRNSWPTKHRLSKDLSRVIIYTQDNSIVDWIFRNRD
jgi:hypothetical protein